MKCDGCGKEVEELVIFTGFCAECNTEEPEVEELQHGIDLLQESLNRRIAAERQSRD